MKYSKCKYCLDNMLNTTYYNKEKAVLTNGFIKKSQKTPRSEKLLAKKYKIDYERYGNE